MPNIIDILARALSLRQETALNSITPNRAGGIMYDTLLVLNQMQLEGGSLLISKVYASVSAMEADTTPTSDLTGRALKPGQLVVIVTSDTSSSDMGSEYRYNGPGSWTYVGKVGGLPLDTVPTQSSTKGITSGGVYAALAAMKAEGYKYMGLATPGSGGTAPGTPNQPVFYIAGPGSYPNFGSITVASGYLGFIKYSGGSWTVESVAVGKDYDEQISTLDGQISQLEAEVSGLVKKDFVWADGYVNGNWQVVSSTVGQFCQPILFKAGDVLHYRSGTGYVKAVIAVQSSAPISVGDNIPWQTSQTLINASATIEYAYVFTEDKYVIISVKKDDNTVYVTPNHKTIPDKINRLDDTKVSKSAGKNLFDNVLTVGYFDAQGNPVLTVNNSRSANFIPIKPNTAYHISRQNDGEVFYGDFGYGVWYDSGFGIISTFAATSKDVTSPANAAYMRVSIRDEYNVQVQIEEGSARTQYEAYNPILGYVSGIPDGFLGKSKINPSDIDLEPTSGSDNLVRSGGVSNNVERNFVRIGCKNIYTNNNIDGKFLESSGNITDSVSYEITDYLPVIPNTKYHASRDGDEIISAGSTALCFYDYKKTHISGLAIGDGNVKTFTTPANCYFIRTTIRKEYNVKVQIEQGEERTEYVAYNPVYDYTVKESSLLGNDAGKAYATALDANTNLTLPDFPTQVKKRFAISFRCLLYNNLFTSVSFGQNYKSFDGAGVKIDATTVYLMDYSNGTETVRMSKEHGISTFDTFLDATLYVDTAANAYITISTLGAFKKIKINNFYYGHSGVVFARSETTITAVKLSATCADFRCPVWAFGDSYFGLSAWRVGYWLRSMGFFSVLWNSLGGQTATGSMADLEKCLQFGTPKYIVWALGMNGAADISGAVNPTWLQETNKLLVICKKYGITPILCTVPTVPGIVHEALSAWVRASGYRYIDVANAVGSQADGTWYAGMRQDDMPSGGSDTAHPSEYGAQIIAQQWLIDFPEIMQYGIENPSGENTMITV